jgi:ribose 1,5-bisphosphokinase PhnN
MIDHLAGPGATPVSGRDSVMDAVRKKKSLEGARGRSRVKKRYHKRPNKSGTALVEQL